MSAVAAAHTRKNLMNYLTAPARVASKMDWKRSTPTATAATASKVLAVDIGHDCIGLAVASHPSSRQPIRTLEPVRVTHETRKETNRRVLSQDCVKSIASIVQEHEVCALLVSWPVQEEGRCGKPCGQVLHALDSLVEESNTIVTKTRPICLWDDRHVKAHYWDEFGRDPIYGRRDRVPKNGEPMIYKASEQQYQHHTCSSTVAAQVFQDFSNTHWPQMDHSAEERIVSHENDYYNHQEDATATDDYDDDEAEELKVAFA